MSRLVKAFLCFLFSFLLVLLILFYPFIHFRYVVFSNSRKVIVGVSYDYNIEPRGYILDNLKRLHELGVRVLRVPLVCDAYNLNSDANNKTETFYSLVEYYGFNVSVVVDVWVDNSTLKFYLERWGKYLSYIQILNEPELRKSWAEGAYFLDDEIFHEFFRIKNITDSFNLNVKYYTNFSPAVVLRSNVLVVLSRYLDFVGFDVYMDFFYYLTPNFIEYVRKLCGGKEVIISEFGCCDVDDVKQADYIINCLDLFSSMGLSQAWIFHYNAVPYCIRGRLAESRVAEWIGRQS